MIALLLEWRFLARDVSEHEPETFRANRGVRLVQAIWYLLVCFSMFLAFALAIALLAAGLSAEAWHYVVAAIGLGLGTGAVLLAPALSLARALVGDILTEWHRKMPWSKVHRLKRGYDTARDDTFDLTRLRRAQRLENWGSVVHDYIRIGSRLREDPPVPSAVADKAYVALDRYRMTLVELRERGDALEQRFAEEFDPVFADAFRIDDRELEGVIQAIRRVARQAG